MRTTVASFALLALTLPAFAQAPTPDRASVDPVKKDLAKQERVEIRQLIEKLGSPDFEVRKRAARKVEAYGKKARELLKETVRESDDAEQVWQARRLLRRIEKGRPALKAQSRGREQDRAQDRAERRPHSGPGTRPSAPGGQDPFGIDSKDFPSFRQGGSPEEFFQRMREFMKHMHGFPQGMQGFPQGMKGKVHSEGTTVRIGPDGVEVDVNVVEDGKKKRKNYKAGSMEELLQKYPELESKVRGFTKSPGMRSFGGSQIDDLEREIQEMERRLQRLLRDDWRDPFPQSRRQGKPPALGKLPPRKLTPHKLQKIDGPKLGIYVGEADTRPVARFLGLPEGVGLWVEGRTEGSLAERLGLAKGDFLVKLGNRWIRGPQDVAQALSGKKKGQELQALWYRKGQKMQKTANL